MLGTLKGERIYSYRAQRDIEVKFIVDCAYVTDEELVHTARLIKASGADFIKTGTGWRPESGATRVQVKLIRDVVGSDFGIKGTFPLTGSAQGVVSLLNAGADIIGTDPIAAMEDYPAYQQKVRTGSLL